MAMVVHAPQQYAKECKKYYYIERMKKAKTAFPQHQADDMPQMSYIQLITTVKKNKPIDIRKTIPTADWKPIPREWYPDNIPQTPAAKRTYANNIKHMKSNQVLVTKSITNPAELKDLGHDPATFTGYTNRFHSERLMDDVFDHWIDALIQTQQLQNRDTLLVFSTNSACSTCSALSGLRNLCSKAKAKDIGVKHCIYLYQKQWKDTELDSLTKQLSDYNVQICPPGYDNANMDYLDVMEYQGQEYGHIVGGYPEYKIGYDPDYASYLDSNSNAAGLESIMVFALGLGSGTLIVCGFCVILLLIAWYISHVLGFRIKRNNDNKIYHNSDQI